MRVARAYLLVYKKTVIEVTHRTTNNKHFHDQLVLPTDNDFKIKEKLSMVELAVADAPQSVHRRAHKPWISIVGRGEASLHLGRLRARDNL